MRIASIALVSTLCFALASPGLADNDKNKGHGGGKAEKHQKHDNDQGKGNGGRDVEQRATGPTVVPYQQIVIVDRDRDTVRTYYRTEYVAGRCPPGLAKKNNGCLPPGQVNRAWVAGQPLPPEIVYYPMPRDLYTQLSPPPYGYEYVRVDDNILLISTATRLIAGMLGNLGNFSD
jgi:Ni/Co efflux regulator RcnB